MSLDTLNPKSECDDYYLVATFVDNYGGNHKIKDYSIVKSNSRHSAVGYYKTVQNKEYYNGIILADIVKNRCVTDNNNKVDIIRGWSISFNDEYGDLVNKPVLEEFCKVINDLNDVKFI